ncbi:MAG: DUF3841 domain-containing protein, partial [Candidatus Omnitrophica bacterium]|nr:DUF3841 domain-containing protein [Candidatus Omnitrophota bacterium]
LNYFYLPSSERDDQGFQRELTRRGLCPYKTKPLSDPFGHREIVKSWDRIFDLGWEDEYISGRNNVKSIQATFWELRADQVLEARQFVAR